MSSHAACTFNIWGTIIGACTLSRSAEGRAGQVCVGGRVRGGRGRAGGDVRVWQATMLKKIKRGSGAGASSAATGP